MSGQDLHFFQTIFQQTKQLIIQDNFGVGLGFFLRVGVHLFWLTLSKWLPIKRTETEGYARGLRDAYYLIETIRQ